MSFLRVALAAATLSIAGASVTAQPRPPMGAAPQTREQLPPSQTSQTVTLSPIHIAACEARNDLQATHYDCDQAPIFEVGYHYLAIMHSGGLQYEDMIYRVAISFDDTVFRGRTILSARLQMYAGQGWNAASDWTQPSSTGWSCTAKIGVPTSSWWTSKPIGAAGDWIDGPMLVTVGPVFGPNVSLDVTPIVKRWSEGEPNEGLLLEGQTENLNIEWYSTRDGGPGKDNGTCVTGYTGAPTLLVTFTGGGEAASPYVHP